MRKLEKLKLKQICWILLSYRFDYTVQHLCNLLYFCNKESLLGWERFMFMCDTYAVAEGFAYEEDAMQIIKEIIFTRDYIEFWLRTAYYYLGYLEYFKNE